MNCYTWNKTNEFHYNIPQYPPISFFRFNRSRWRPVSMFSRTPGHGSNGKLYLQFKYLSLPRRMGRPKLWYNLIRQHRLSNVNCVSMCQYGRLDTHSICSKLIDTIENIKRCRCNTACNSFLFFTIHFIFQFYTCIYLEVFIAVLLLFRCKFCIITCLPFATTVTL